MYFHASTHFHTYFRNNPRVKLAFLTHAAKTSPPFDVAKYFPLSSHHMVAIIPHDNGMNIWIKEIPNYNTKYKFINLDIHASVYMYSPSNDGKL